MPTKKIYAKQVTEGGADEGRALGAYEGSYSCGDATFNRSHLTCRFEGKTFRRIRGGHWSAEANYFCEEDGEAYLIREVADCESDHRKKMVGKFLRKSRKVELS